MKEKISAIILFAGEESIKNAIDSLKFCDEILVVHDCSSGEKNTSLIPKKNFNLKILHKSLSSFSSQRNFGLEKAKNEWILYLDADEVIPEKLANKISAKILKSNTSGYTIRRVDNFIGKTISKGELLNIYLLRLARKNKGKWSGVVHERWNIKGKVEKISEPIYHYPHPTISEFITEIDKYTSLRGSELHSARVRSGFSTIIIYPLLKFLWNYLFKLGFLEGNRGFVLSMMMSFHSFLSRSKLYQSAHESHSQSLIK